MPSTSRIFGTVNRLVEPLVQSGVGNSLAGPGTFVLETTGRRSGLARRVPLLGHRLGDTIVVSTVRSDSRWVRNLEANPKANVWIGGEQRSSVAAVSRLPIGAVATLRVEPRPRPTPEECP